MTFGAFTTTLANEPYAPIVLLSLLLLFRFSASSARTTAIVGHLLVLLGFLTQTALLSDGASTSASSFIPPSVGIPVADKVLPLLYALGWSLILLSLYAALKLQRRGAH